MGARCLSSVNQEVAPCYRLGIHYLRLPGFNVYISGDLRSPPPSWKKESVLPWVECHDHHLTNRCMGWTYTYGILVNSLLAWDSVCEALIICVSTLYVCPDGLWNDREKLNPVPGMVLRFKHISRSSKHQFTKLVPISRYFIFIPDLRPPNGIHGPLWY